MSHISLKEMEFISWLMEKIYIFAAQSAETSLLLHVRRKTVENLLLVQAITERLLESIETGAEVYYK